MATNIVTDNDTLIKKLNIPLAIVVIILIILLY